MHRLKTYHYYAILVLLYVFIVLIMRPNPATIQAYHLDSSSYRVLLLAITGVPLFLTWFAAFYGYDQLQRYNRLVKGTDEGSAFNDLTVACRWLCMYLPIVSIVSLILIAIANVHESMRPAIGIVTNYAAVILSLVAMTAFGRGARDMADSVNTRPSLFKTRLLMLSFIIMGVFYCYLLIRHSFGDAHAYHMPLSILLATIVVPLFFAWSVGLLAVLDIEAYSGKVAGVIYRKALQRLSFGFLAIIIGAILLQYMYSVNPPIGRLMIGGILLFRYVLYACLAGGFLLIASAAKKLQQMEKI